MNNARDHPPPPITYLTFYKILHLKPGLFLGIRANFTMEPISFSLNKYIPVTFAKNGLLTKKFYEARIFRHLPNPSVPCICKRYYCMPTTSMGTHTAKIHISYLTSTVNAELTLWMLNWHFLWKLFYQYLKFLVETKCKVSSSNKQTFIFSFSFLLSSVYSTFLKLGTNWQDSKLCCGD